MLSGGLPGRPPSIQVPYCYAMFKVPKVPVRVGPYLYPGTGNVLSFFPRASGGTMKQHSGFDSYDNAPVRARRSARSRAGRNLKLNKAPTTLVQLHEHQKKASKKRKMARDRARRKCERAEYLQLKAEKLSLSNKGGSGPHSTPDQPDEKNARARPAVGF